MEKHLNEKAVNEEKEIDPDYYDDKERPQEVSKNDDEKPLHPTKGVEPKNRDCIGNPYFLFDH